MAAILSALAPHVVQEIVVQIKKSSETSESEKSISSCVYSPEKGEKVDVAGLDDELADIHKRCLFPLLNHEELVQMSSLLAAPTGALLYGPPGTGKTMIAKQIANNSGIPLINVSPSNLKMSFVGQSEKMVAAMFSVARKIQPCVIFIDEIDAILGIRKSNEPGYETSLKSEFLSQWQGIASSSTSNEHDRILVLGATNRKEAIDEASLRRMPIQIHVGLPQCHKRVQLLKLFLAKTRVCEGFDYDKLASQMEGYSGSVIQDCCSDACRKRFQTSEENSGTQFLEFADFFINGRLHHADRVVGHALKPADSHSSHTWDKWHMILVTCVVLLIGLFSPLFFRTANLMHRFSLLSHWMRGQERFLLDAVSRSSHIGRGIVKIVMNGYHTTQAAVPSWILSMADDVSVLALQVAALLLLVLYLLYSFVAIKTPLPAVPTTPATSQPAFVSSTKKRTGPSSRTISTESRGRPVPESDRGNGDTSQPAFVSPTEKRTGPSSHTISTEIRGRPVPESDRGNGGRMFGLLSMITFVAVVGWGYSKQTRKAQN